MDENRNYLLAIALSIIVLAAWQFFVAGPQIEGQRQQNTVEAPSGTGKTAPSQPDLAPKPAGEDAAAGVDASAPAAGGLPDGGKVVRPRGSVLAASPRIDIDTPSLSGSINLKGGRIDDISLRKYRETVEKDSPNIVLLSPSGSAHPYYAEYGWVADPGSGIATPNAESVWTVESGGPLRNGAPVVLSWDNGAGLKFTRKISVDDKYMFTVEQSVENSGGEAVTLYPYGLVSRTGTPKTTGYYILHEGLIGVLGESGLTEIDYDDLKEKREIAERDVARGWLGITDKYWAVTLIPSAKTAFDARYTYRQFASGEVYQVDYLGKSQTVPAGGRVATTNMLFAGAKETATVDGYNEALDLERFDLLIDWGWFYFITKPLFYVIDWFFRLFGNFGVAILAVTVLVKLIFFPLANKSYVSMSRMKKVQPAMKELQERYKDDKARQQQALMELYKKEKINPLSGCLPIVIQIPVFFALYKVLFVTIEMRHAPFFGWIKDLAARDPTTVFNLFGLIPWTPPDFLMIGVWPLLMGITMFLQMKLNPAPTDPIQASIFTWMPVIFTFILAPFPAGLVIYWSWNNTLSIIQQMVIMKKQGVKIELWDNLMAMVRKKSGDTGG